MSELLPCPFCGADSTQLYVAKTYDSVKIGCLSCSVQFLLANHFGNDKEAVVSAWNTRAERMCKRFWTGAEMVCSRCAHQLNDATANFCPNCGAKVVEQ